MKKVIITANTSWNLVNFRKKIIQELILKGYEVMAIAPEDEHTPELQRMGCPFYPLSMQATGSNPFQDLKVMRQYQSYFKKLQPDYVLSYTIKPNIYGSLATRKGQPKVICNISGLGTVFMSQNASSRLALLLYRLALRRSHWVFFQNADDQNEFLLRGLVHPEKTGLLPGSGVDLSRFRYKKLQPASPFTFLIISRYLIDKGLYELAEALRMLKAKNLNFHCILMGKSMDEHKRGIPEREVKAWEEEGLLELAGEQSDVRPYLYRSHCVLLPSYREGTPKTLLEAAACGRPLLASDVPGCREIVKHEENGYLFEVKNAKALAASMEKIMEGSKSEWLAMGHRSRERVEKHFDERIVAAEYLKKIT